jgi:hypothetical protein
LRLSSFSPVALVGIIPTGLVHVNVSISGTIFSTGFPRVLLTNWFDDELTDPDDPEAVAKRDYQMNKKFQ